MKTHIINDHITVVEKDNERLVHPYSVVVDGVEVSQHQTLMTAKSVAGVCQLVYNIAITKGD